MNDTVCEQSPGAEHSGVLRVMYLFAGRKRVGDLGDWLDRKAGSDKLLLDQVDIIRGKQCDLAKGKLRSRLLERVRAGKVDLLVASPPCSTFSRARMSGRPGPPALRSAAWLRGFPRLRGKAAKKVKEANLFILFTVEILQAQSAAGGWWFLEHPEDLGKRPSGVPGSIWRWPELSALAEHSGVETGALLQSDWGVPYAKPTRFMFNLPRLREIVCLGWPCFAPDGAYLGPLSRKRGHGELI